MHLSLSPGATIATVAVAALAVTGGIVAAVEIGGTPGAQVAAKSKPIPKPVVAVAHSHHHQVNWWSPLTLRARKGKLTSVDVRGSGEIVHGTVTPNGAVWRSRTTRLFPDTAYVARITVADRAGAVHSVTRKVTTKPAKHFVTGIMSPNAETVGVGEPVSIHFEEAVPESKRAEVEKQLTVSTTPYVNGAWHWFDDWDVHWRPAHYWKPGTHVAVGMNLSHIYFGNGVWGQEGAHKTSFTIGNALISDVNVPDHWMKVYDNGKLIRTMPISAGSPTYPTMGGIHVTLEKSPSVIMDSATVGIPKGSPDYYYEVVYWDVRISDSGAFVHAAPWSVADQGNTNVSHGCINVSPSNAEWFYNFSHGAGDIVSVYNPVRGPSSSDPGTEDWNMSWSQWLAGDALPHSKPHHHHNHRFSGHKAMNQSGSSDNDAGSTSTSGSGSSW